MLTCIIYVCGPMYEYLNVWYMYTTIGALKGLNATQISSHILEQPISLQILRRKTRKRQCSLVLFIPVGAGAAPACTRTKKIKNICTSSSFPTQYSQGFNYLCLLCIIQQYWSLK
jgi:hypothetical protein